MSALLDVNVLLALFDPEHIHHAEAIAWWADHRDEGWASCPLTQNGFVRVISGSGYERPLPMAEALAVLSAQLERPDHEFWLDDISLADAGLFDHARLRGANQITDVYLLALAVKNGGRLVTFDRGIAIGAVRGAEAKHMVSL
ncbi:MAG: PIN domain-containing protein [Pseudolabrys sp.]|nr:PIN domain-containing protein [Pseudolabrys sp.]